MLMRVFVVAEIPLKVELEVIDVATGIILDSV